MDGWMDGWMEMIDYTLKQSCGTCTR